MQRSVHLEEWCFKELLPQVKALAQDPVTHPLPAVGHPVLSRLYSLKGALPQGRQGTEAWSQGGGAGCEYLPAGLCSQVNTRLANFNLAITTHSIAKHI